MSTPSLAQIGARKAIAIYALMYHAGFLPRRYVVIQREPRTGCTYPRLFKRSV